MRKLTASDIVENSVTKYGLRDCCPPDDVVYVTTGSLTYPSAHARGDVVDWMVPKF